MTTENELLKHITKLEMLLEPLLLLADELIDQKGLRWATHYEALPIHILYREDGKYTMPLIQHCLKAKEVVEGYDN